MTVAKRTPLNPLLALGRLLTGGAVAQAAIITAGGFVIAQALRLVSNLVTTRLLVDEPEAFGLMGVAVMINSLVVMLTDVGIQSSIIRSDRGDDPVFARTAWVTAIARNAGLTVVVLLGAAGIMVGQAHGVFPEGSILVLPELPGVVAAIGVTLLISGFNSINVARARRHMRAVRVTTFEVAMQTFSSLVTIALCYAGYGVWGLVGGTVVGAVSFAILSHVVMPGPVMRFAWDKDSFLELFSFGKWLLLASACGFLVGEADKVIFAFFLDAEALSLYVIATIWISAVIGLFSKVVQMAFYPALSRAYRADPDSIAPTYARLRRVIDTACLIGFVALFFGSDPLFALLYEGPFETASRYFAILILVILLLPYRLLNVVLLSRGDSRRYTLVTAAGALWSVTAVPAAFVTFGEIAAVAVFATRNVATALVTLYLTRRLVPFSLWREGRMLLATALGTALVLVGV